VFLQEGDLLRITQAELLRFGLYKGMQLSEDQLAELKASGTKSQLRAAAARMASGRMLSKKELKDRLCRKGAEAVEAEETADWLESLGAVDDTAYAGVIVRHYGAMGYGPGRVRQELQRRGVPRQLWAEALTQLPPAEDMIRTFVESKTKGKTLDTAAVKRLSDALLRRGFSWNDIRPALQALGREINED